MKTYIILYVIGKYQHPAKLGTAMVKVKNLEDAKYRDGCRSKTSNIHLLLELLKMLRLHCTATKGPTLRYLLTGGSNKMGSGRIKNFKN